jgi:hypothetical protein
VNLAQSLMKMGNREWRMGNGEKAVPNPQDIAQILDRAIQQAKSLKDQRAESYAQGILGELYEKTKTGQRLKTSPRTLCL